MGLPKIPAPTGVLFAAPRWMTEHELQHAESLLNEMPKHNVLVTATMYPEKAMCSKPAIVARANLALRMFTKARDDNYTIICVDRGSDPGWRSEVRDIGVRLIDEDNEIPGYHSLGKNRRQAMLAGLDLEKPLLTWLEPEKHTYIRASDKRRPVAMAATPVYSGEANIVVPRREDTSSYPAAQQFLEATCNVMTMNYLRAALMMQGMSENEAMQRAPYLDYWAGPKTLHRDVAHYFTRYSGKIEGVIADAYESIIVPALQMILDGKKVKGVAVPYSHPQEQSLFEGSDISYDLKRIEQADKPLRAFRLLLGFEDVKVAA